jgi:hypothetical protein
VAYSITTHDSSIWRNLPMFLSTMALPSARELVTELRRLLYGPLGAFRYLAFMLLWRRLAVVHAGVTRRPEQLLAAELPVESWSVEEQGELLWADCCNLVEVRGRGGFTRRHKQMQIHNHSGMTQPQVVY